MLLVSGLVPSILSRTGRPKKKSLGGRSPGPDIVVYMGTEVRGRFVVSHRRLGYLQQPTPRFPAGAWISVWMGALLAAPLPSLELQGDTGLAGEILPISFPRYDEAVHRHWIKYTKFWTRRTRTGMTEAAMNIVASLPHAMKG